MFVQPIVTVEDDGGGFYHVEIGADVRPAGLTELTVNPAGIYVEDAEGNWDLVSWDELEEMLEGRMGKGNVFAPVGFPGVGYTVIGDAQYAELVGSDGVVMAGVRYPGKAEVWHVG